MPITQITTQFSGQVGVEPQIIRIVSTDNYATITAAGYLDNVIKQGYVINALDILLISYNSGTSTGFFSITFTNGVSTLAPNAGDVVLPVVSGDFANFSGTSGTIIDAGFSPSNAAKTKVVMANAATVANHIMVSTDTAGTSGNLTGTAINDGSIQAGRSTVAGSLSSFPSAGTKGSLAVTAVANTGDTITTISNAAMGQASTVSIPDPGAATANFIMSAIAGAGTQHVTTGSLQIDTGNLTAGSAGSAGTVTSFPATTGNGTLILSALNAGGAFNTTIRNSIMAQSSVFSIPDPAGATANFVVAPSALVSGNLVSASGTAGLVVDSTVVANRVLFTTFASPDAAVDLVRFDITVGQAALAAGGSVTLQTSSGSKQYKISMLWLNSGGTNFSGGGGDRLLQITDGTTVYSVIPAANLQSLVNAGWGINTVLPYPATAAINTSTAAGASLVAKYSGGATDYTAGSLVLSGMLVRVA